MKLKSLFLVLPLGAVFFLSSCGGNAHKSNHQGVDSHNSENSLDWAGVYQGTLPCADCEGILTTLQLENSEDYKLQSKYLGAKEDSNTFVEGGKFKWNKDGNVVRLENGDQYAVGENLLTRLDQNGQKISGELAGFYILNKVDHQLENVHWELTSLEGQEIKEDISRKPYLLLNEKDSRVSGNGGCNQIMGTYTLKGDSGITFSRMASTMMACPDLEFEDKFNKALGEVDSYAFQDGKLILKASDKDLAEFRPVFFDE